MKICDFQPGHIYNMHGFTIWLVGIITYKGTITTGGPLFPIECLIGWVYDPASQCWTGDPTCEGVPRRIGCFLPFSDFEEIIPLHN